METLTQLAVRHGAAGLCYFTDNKSTMCREAIGLDGEVKFTICAAALCATDRVTRNQVMGSIGDAPWGTFFDMKI